MDQTQNCEHCRNQIHCRNLYVAVKILCEELRFVDRSELREAFETLQADMNAAGYAYPYGGSACPLPERAKDARPMVLRAKEILREVRRTVSICPA